MKDYWGVKPGGRRGLRPKLAARRDDVARRSKSSGRNAAVTTCCWPDPATLSRTGTERRLWALPPVLLIILLRITLRKKTSVKLKHATKRIIWLKRTVVRCGRWLDAKRLVTRAAMAHWIALALLVVSVRMSLDNIVREYEASKCHVSKNHL